MIIWLRQKFGDYIHKKDGLSAAETAIIFPILLTFLIGVYEIGMGVMSNQKAIRASQITADLLSRERSVTDADILEALEAARQAVLPLDDTNLGIDVVSVEYEQDSAGNETVSTLWRETQNMDEDVSVLTDLQGLGDAGEGALAVVVKYEYEPIFSQFIFNKIEMREVAFVRSRKSSIIVKQN